MAAPSAVRNGEPPGLLEIAVRYGVLLGVVTYAVGLLAEAATRAMVHCTCTRLN